MSLNQNGRFQNQLYFSVHCPSEFSQSWPHLNVFLSLCYTIVNILVQSAVQKIFKEVMCEATHGFPATKGPMILGHR